MIAIAVDDEPLMLGALVAAIKASPDVTEVFAFSGCDDALDFIACTPADIAFLDINMRGIGGLALAEKILESRPVCKIVFCTGHEEYAIPDPRFQAARLGVFDETDIRRGRAGRDQQHQGHFAA